MLRAAYVGLALLAIALLYDAYQHSLPTFIGTFVVVVSMGYTIYTLHKIEEGPEKPRKE